MTQPKRLTVPQQIEDFYPSYTTAVDLLETLQRLIKEYGDKVYIDSYFMSYDDTKYYAFYYPRPENDDEYNTRIAQELKWKEQTEDRDRREFERLKQKFGRP
ncbi:hypothetical protein RsoM2USA_164 [Ralstonia phage RsoM2USA]|nr:hypothetical protein RsoM2USA_164 [Ralstonia phage RsoM2USA]